MNEDSLRKFIAASLFHPFAIHRADRRSVEAPHPELIMMTEEGHTAIVGTGGTDFEVIDVSLITSAKRIKRQRA